MALDYIDDLIGSLPRLSRLCFSWSGAAWAPRDFRTSGMIFYISDTLFLVVLTRRDSWCLSQGRFSQLVDPDYLKILRELSIMYSRLF